MPLMGACARKRDGGFTLIEMMVTIVVLAILIAVAVPSFSDFIEKARLRGAADALSSQFTVARTEAVRADRNVTLSVVGEDGVWCTGARQFAAAGTAGLVDASGSASCDCSDTPAACMVAGNQSVVDSGAFAGVDLQDADALSFTFDRKTGTLLDLTAHTLKLRSAEDPDRFGLNVVTTPMGHARTCIPDGYASFGGYRPC